MSLSNEIKYGLNQIRTLDEAFLFWAANYKALDKYTMILSTPGISQTQIGARTRFGKTGFLASLFAHDHLYFMNHSIGRDMLSSKLRADFAIDIDILFDTNAASYLVGSFESRQHSKIEDFFEMLRHFKGNRLNWNSVLYQIENSEALLKGERLDSIFSTILADEKWSDMDREYFVRSGKLRANSADHVYFEAVTKRLGDWHRQLSGGMHEAYRDRYNLSYAVTLQMIIIQLERPSPKDAFYKLREMLRLMHEEWTAIFLRFSVIAWELFSRQPGSFALFKPIQKGTPDLLRKVRNIAWDLHHFQFLEQLVPYKGRNGSFLIPYMLTFDRGLSDLWDLYPIRSCIYDEEENYPLCVPERKIEDEWEALLPPNKFKEIQKYFTFEAALDRHSRRKVDQDLTRQIESLENKLLTISI